MCEALTALQRVCMKICHLLQQPQCPPSNSPKPAPGPCWVFRQHEKWLLLTPGKQREGRRQRILSARLHLPQHPEWCREGSQGFVKWAETKWVIYPPRTGATRICVLMHPGAVMRASTQGMTSFTQGWVKHTCPLIKPLIQGRYEKESFSSQFYVRTYSKSPRYNCCITHFSCWQMWFSNAVGKMVAPCGVAILHKAVLPSLPHLQRFFPWNVCDVPYQNPQGHKKGQQKESKMANRNGRLSKSGNFGRE